MEIKIDPQKVLEELENDQPQETDSSKNKKRVVLTAKVQRGKLVEVKNTLPLPDENNKQAKS